VKRAVLLACALVLSSAASAADRPPKTAFAPVRLVSLPPPAARACKRLQASVSFTVLCPARLPTATLGYPAGSKPPRLRADFFGDRFHPQKRLVLGIEFFYGTPVEPFPGTWWRRHVWLNRPAYFLHVTIWRRWAVHLPVWRAQLHRRCFSHRCGLIKYASGYGLRGTTDAYWANHTWFFWRERGVRWAASLHYFGRGETTALLARILRELRPARDL
jgi:hypothetical protein